MKYLCEQDNPFGKIIYEGINFYKYITKMSISFKYTFGKMIIKINQVDLS